LQYFKDWRNPTEEEIKILKDDRLESDNTSIDSIIYKLEKLGSGAKIHTINKAKFHLNYLSKNEKERFKFGKHYDRLSELMFEVFIALKYGEWKELEQYMKGMY